MIQLSGKNGGGQILRSSLTLSMITGQPFRLNQIRGARPKPGLARQHLTCVKAATEICHGSVDGAEMGSTLPALWQSQGASTLTLEGGTHNPMAPPMDYLTRVYLPTLKKMGLTIEASLERYGFVPAGGGSIHFKLPGDQKLRPLEILERGEELERRIHCINSHIPPDVAQKETKALLNQLDRVTW